MFRALVGFLLFTFLTILGMAITLGVIEMLIGGHDPSIPSPWELWAPPALALPFTILLMLTWQRSGCFHLLYFTGLGLLVLAAACVIAEWPRVGDPAVYELENWPTPPNFVLFGKFLTIALLEYSGVAFLGAALLHERLVRILRPATAFRRSPRDV